MMVKILEKLNEQLDDRYFGFLGLLTDEINTSQHRQI
jgi:hypothetical protein